MSRARRARFADLIVEGKTIAEAAAEMRISQTTAYTWCREPQVEFLIDSGLDEIRKAALRRLRRSGDKVARTLESLAVRKGQPNSGHRVTACLAILDRIGLGATAHVKVEHSGGLASRSDDELEALVAAESARLAVPCDDGDPE